MSSFDANEFKRNLRRAAEQSANEGMRKISADLQRMFDGLLKSHGGQPIEEVKTAVRTACQRHQLKLDESELMQRRTCCRASPGGCSILGPSLRRAEANATEFNGRHRLLVVLSDFELRGALSITVAGCTDPEGGVDSPYNVTLGLQRAQASVAVLEADGLPASILQPVSWADTHPVTHLAGLDTPTVNALDRRIVIVVTKAS